MSSTRIEIGSTEIIPGDEVIGFNTKVKTVEADDDSIVITFESGEPFVTSNTSRLAVLRDSDALLTPAGRSLVERIKTQHSIYAGECRAVAKALDNLGVATLAARCGNEASTKILMAQRKAVVSALKSYTIVTKSFDWMLITNRAIELKNTIPLGVYGATELMDLASLFRRKANAIDDL